MNKSEKNRIGALKQHEASKKIRLEKLLTAFTKKHGDKYDYSVVKENFTTQDVKGVIYCKKHDLQFEQNLGKHKKHTACPKCLEEMSKKDNNFFFERIKGLYEEDNYDYSKVDYKDAKTRVTIICNKHKRSFTKEPRHFFNGSGCPDCRRERSEAAKKKTTEEMLSAFNSVHNDKYKYPDFIFTDNKQIIKPICPDHGEFEIMVNNHQQGKGCQKCGCTTSKAEEELANIVVDLGFDVIKNDKKVLDGLEADILIEDKKVIIEYDGLYYHSDKFKDKNYHLNKTKIAEEKGYKLLHVFEDEWLTKKSVVISRVKNILGVTENKIFARKTKIVEVDNKTCNKFLEENHIQGKVNSKIRIGLEYEGEIVSIMTFGSFRKHMGRSASEGKYELLRFCNKKEVTVVGGASKLLKHFIKNYNPINIISYADRRWSQGELYDKLGFKFIRNTIPNYFYTKDITRYSRFMFRKDILVKDGWDKSLTEKQIMKNRGYNRVYDCGSKLYEI